MKQLVSIFCKMINDRRVQVIFIIALICVCLFLYCQSTRYYLQGSNHGDVYKIDRWTGRTWWIVGDEEILVEKKPSSLSKEVNKTSASKDIHKTPEELVIEFAKQFGSGKLAGVSSISEALSYYKGSIKIIGWSAKRIDDQTYLVAFEYETAEGIVGYYFEVNLVMQIIRSVAGDPDLEKKHGLQCVISGCYENRPGCSTCKRISVQN